MALSYAFNANAGETPQTLAQRRQLADTIASRIFGQAPKNLGEGLNAVGQALIARSMLDETDAAQKAGLATVPSWLGGTGTATATPASVPDAATPPALTAAPMGNLPTPQSSANTSAKIYSNDEPSPLDPPSDNDRQALIATILGEAGNQGPAGMNAVASVVRNRAVNGGFGGDTPAQVVTAKNQFEPWNTTQGRAKMATAMQSPQQVAAANAAIDSAYAGNDPTNGATMFYSPTAQAALGRTAPAWAQGPSQDIGDHRFYGGAPVPPTQVAQAGQATQEDSGGPALAFAGQPTQSASPIPQPAQTAPQPAQPKLYGGPFPNVSTEDLTKQAFNPWIPASTKQILSAEITRRATADQQANDPLRQLQIQTARKSLEKSDAPNSVQEYEYYKQNFVPTAQQPQPMNYDVWSTAKARAAATSITNNVGADENSFQKEAGKVQAQRFNDLVGEGQQAKQLVADIGTLTELGRNIGTGKSAQIRAAIGPYAEALGVKVEGLSDIQAYEAIVNRVAPTLRVKGSGAQSDLELKNFLKSLPSLGNTPEGNETAAVVLQGLQQNKVAAADIASKALNGEITRAEADKQLRSLPDPMEPYRAYAKHSGPAAPAAAKVESLKKKYGLD